MARKIWIGLLWLAMVLTCGFQVCAQEAEDPDLERAKQVAAEVVAAVVAEQGAEADETEILLKVIAALRRELGVEHPLTLRFMARTGFQLWEQGVYAEAR